ncbi:hypothetical protein DFJ74DRAFT_694744 [Hyaloraphidium curvatum]|nr:hypothetical protein DFJ74DRAFT_694744 [Hyaloraphidium curvatum]
MDPPSSLPPIPTSVFRILGGPGSPFSLKLRAAFRARRIPHTFAVPQGYLASSGELKTADKGIIPVLQVPGGAYWSDTTPIMEELERLYPGQRSLLPDDPVDRFLARLIEDFADEVLVYAMFDYRWHLERDQAWCSRRQMAGWLGAIPAEAFDKAVAQFRGRQTNILARLGDADLNRPFCRHMFVTVLEAIELQLNQSRFLFGSRPSVADIGLYGMLSQLAIDPTASDVLKYKHVRAFQWVQDVDDLSGMDGSWRNPGEPLGQGTRALLDLVAKTYVPLMKANAAALLAGKRKVEVELAGFPVAAVAVPYKLKCWNWTRLALAEAVEAGAPDLEATLRELGIWEALQFAPGERQQVVPMSPTTGDKRASPFAAARL